MYFNFFRQKWNIKMLSQAFAIFKKKDLGRWLPTSVQYKILNYINLSKYYNFIVILQTTAQIHSSPTTYAQIIKLRPSLSLFLRRMPQNAQLLLIVGIIVLSNWQMFFLGVVSVKKSIHIVVFLRLYRLKQLNAAWIVKRDVAYSFLVIVDRCSFSTSMRHLSIYLDIRIELQFFNLYPFYIFFIEKLFILE